MTDPTPTFLTREQAIALLARMQAIGFVPGSEDPIVWLVSEVERLQSAPGAQA